MFKIYLSIVFVAGLTFIQAPSTYAQIVEIESNSDGFLPPRMDSIQRDAIAYPSAGMMIFNTSTGRINYYENIHGWEELYPEPHTTLIDYLNYISGGLQTLLDAGEQVQSLLDTGVTLQAFLHSGVSLMNLVDAGIAVQMLLDHGETPLSLLDGGLTVQTLLDGGETVQTLLAAEVSPILLLHAGVNLQALLDAGETVVSLLDAGGTVMDLLDGGMTAQSLLDAGVTSEELLVAGVSVQDLLDAGETVQTLLAAGISPLTLFSAGVTLQQLLDAGETFVSLLDAGITIHGLLDAGGTVQELLAGGVTVADMLSGDISIQTLLDGGVTPLNILNTCIPTSDFIGLDFEGGIIFHIEADGTGLVAAPTDQGASVTWGCSGTDVVGANETIIGSGNQNTIDIEAGCATSGTAADICANLILNGYDDWFLPSLGELYQMYFTLGQGGSVCNNIGGFVPFVYWSSSEDSFDHARLFNFNNGVYGINPKNIAYYVRAIRAF